MEEIIKDIQQHIKDVKKGKDCEFNQGVIFALNDVLKLIKSK